MFVVVLVSVSADPTLEDVFSPIADFASAGIAAELNN